MIPDSTGTRQIEPGEDREPVKEDSEKGGCQHGGERHGLREILEEDFHRLHPKLVATFRRLGATPEEARDLTQEALLRAHRGLDTFVGRSQLDTWAVSIAKRVWLQHVRDQGRQKRSADEVSLETIQEETAGEAKAALDLEAELLAKCRLGRIKRAIGQLPEAMRQALTLHIEGHKYRRIAVLLGVSENRVSSLIHQARQKLRREVSEQPAD